MNILTVDDSDTIRRIIGAAVQTFGYNILEGNCGTEALKVLKENKDNVGLVLLDWNMPGMNGLEVLQEIKANDETRDIPVMMVTTESEKSYIVKAVQAGAVNYLIKPFTHEELAGKILECLGTV